MLNLYHLTVKQYLFNVTPCHTYSFIIMDARTHKLEKKKYDLMLKHGKLKTCQQDKTRRHRFKWTKKKARDWGVVQGVSSQLWHN